jgi:hypothetical protein
MAEDVARLMLIFKHTCGCGTWINWNLGTFTIYRVKNTCANLSVQWIINSEELRTHVNLSAQWTKVNELT